MTTFADRTEPTHVVDSVAGLRELYRQPTKLVAEKKLDHIPPWARAMIGAARFVFLATASKDGRPTVSPKGGDAGFVAVLDERTVAIPDFPGNNLLDSLQHIVENGEAGVIVVMPGRPETLRIDGEAWITTAPAILERWTESSRRPKTAIVIRTREVFFHCPASFQRAELWEPASWDAETSFAEFVRAALPRDEWPDWAVD